MNTVQTEEQVIIPTATPSIEIDEKIKDELLTQFEEQGMVIVHCSFTAILSFGIRIWSSTFLIDRLSGTKCKLLHALNITFAPVWMPVESGTKVRFTLIFSTLPRTCEQFDLIEEIPEAGGFEIFGIKRNPSDVYNVIINDSVF
jgi:hypothetical protein